MGPLGPLVIDELGLLGISHPRIRLDVSFGTKGHFHREPTWFEVVDLSSPYHTLSGRPVLAKFMAVPHYACVKLKTSGPKGIITIADDYKKSLECAAAGSRLAESLVIAEEKRSSTSSWLWRASG
ncbi:uncharacterized protein [Aegilops tauschii subsp. strangulata]|uniref:uncharacterized protein n=1 Tax=Aegilops tauschii subsp. strangulata TaxID=200361 RepID=UPI003CC85873